MKTKEFMRKVKELGFLPTGFIREYEDLYIYDGKWNTVMTLNNKKVGIIHTNTNAMRSLDTELRLKLFKLAVEYSMTPIEEREEEHKYYLKLPAPYDVVGIYLHFDMLEGTYFLVSEEVKHNGVKTQFTQEEIDQLPNQEFIKTLIKEEVE